MRRDRRAPRRLALVIAALAALALPLLSACVGYTTGPGGTTIHRVGLPVAGAPPARAGPVRPAVLR